MCPQTTRVWPIVAFSWPHAHVFLAKNRIQIRGPLGIIVTSFDKTSAFEEEDSVGILRLQSQSEASSNKASNTISQHWTVFEASLKSASQRFKYSNTGTVPEIVLGQLLATRDSRQNFSCGAAPSYHFPTPDEGSTVLELSLKR